MLSMIQQSGPTVTQARRCGGSKSACSWQRRAGGAAACLSAACGAASSSEASVSGRCHIGVVPLAAPRRRRAGSVVRGPEPPRINIDDLMLDVPEIDGDIRSLQVEMGAIFNDAGLATTFGKKKQALQALETGLVLVDQSHWSRLRVSGDDRLTLLHNQSTQDFKALRPGQGADTVFVTATGRCLDLATALVLPSSVMLMVAEGTSDEAARGARPAGAALLERLNKMIFRGDKVAVQDVSERTAQISLMGPEAEAVLRELAPDALAAVLGAPAGAHVLVGFRGKPVFVVAGSGLGPGVPGYTLIADESIGGDVYAAFAAKGAIPMGTDDWEAARVLAGRPLRGAELTEEHNPLEAGLYGAVSLNKGCYIGQETLAKLHLRDGVNRQLWGLALSGSTAPGTQITSELSKVGVVTSACQDAEGEWVGLGYIRSRIEGTQIALEGVRVAVGGTPATVTAIPFATRKLSAAAEAPTSSDTVSGRLEDAKKKKEEEAAAKEAATAAKLQAMQERLAAWQAQQKQQTK
ncbi:hypothetical protein CHLRE_12g552850v5 [Chlamydomonas reinhardtii]|uniref:GCVT N-terminal domain-containing protein n=1 Tax=Chlamydomonas reinhardtii TaxID=3055 RepID=A0A2K3D614_CHLRE|nr:uncharacterized protein CHLRE_12g552850v5 [Chlamydomonas reinhardtii]PNW75971.1 hypothetical protein CHLRE_12g552850v5 [Chlamydomonas reinhardtii]